jgi:hypothetical protein
MKKTLVVTMPDGSRWGMPVLTIARNRADHYKSEFGGNFNRSLNEDTIPLFTSDPDEIADWAANNMNWADVKVLAHLVKAPPVVDYQEGWVNGEKELED